MTKRWTKRWTYEKQISILLIDEDPGEQAVFKKFFNQQEDKYKYIIAQGVEDALQQIKEHHFDVIISDISFIDGNVFDILPHSREIPTIIITAKGDEEIAVKVLQRGAAEYVLRDVERKYLQILPSLILKAARQSRSKLITEILFRALRDIDRCICVINTDGLIIFANKAFCDMFRLKDFYYMTDINTILKNFKISGEPGIETVLKQEIEEEARYEIHDTQEDREGNIRLIPVSGAGDFMLGYVMIGTCNGTRQKNKS